MNVRGARPAIAAAAIATVLSITPVTRIHAARTSSAEQRAGATGPADWNTVSVDITIDRKRADESDSTAPSLPRTRYRLERTLGRSGWHTTVTLTAMDRPLANSPMGPRPISNPFHIGRIEFDDSGAGPTVYDPFGRVIAQPTAEQLQRWTARARADRPDLSLLLPSLPGGAPPKGRATSPPSREWIEHLMPSPEGWADRRRSVQQRFGAVVGSERGLERYISTERGVTYELLLEPGTATPAEMNVVRDNRLQSHTRFSYQRNDEDRLTLKSVRIETLMDEPAGTRAVTELEYANLRLSLRGA